MLLFVIAVAVVVQRQCGLSNCGKMYFQFYRLQYNSIDILFSAFFCSLHSFNHLFISNFQFPINKCIEATSTFDVDMSFKLITVQRFTFVKIKCKLCNNEIEKWRNCEMRSEIVFPVRRRSSHCNFSNKLIAVRQSIIANSYFEQHFHLSFSYNFTNTMLFSSLRFYSGFFSPKNVKNLCFVYINAISFSFVIHGVNIGGLLIFLFALVDFLPFS